MRLSLANKDDLTSIMQIIEDAQKILAHENIDQWQNGYPSQSIIENDIKNNECFVVKSIKNMTLATAMFSLRKEPTYKKIEGKWLSSDESSYGVVHRMAISKLQLRKGVAKFILNSCEEILREKNIKSMRIDTHEKNFPMQNLLKKLNYNYCGVIYLEDNSKRLAYEKRI